MQLTAADDNGGTLSEISTIIQINANMTVDHLAVMVLIYLQFKVFQFSFTRDRLRRIFLRVQISENLVDRFGVKSECYRSRKG